MPSFVPANPASNSIGSEGNIVQSTQNTDFGSFEHSFGFRIEDAINLSRNPVFNQIKSNSRALGTDIQVRALNKSVVASETDQSSTASASQRIPLQKESQRNLVSIPGGHSENWGDSNMADTSPRTETSTDDTDDRNQRELEAGPSAALVASDSSGRSKEKPADQKTLRRLAQNREAARKSRLRKKAYVQQLESSRLKLTQLEQELQRARQQGIFISSSGDQSHSNSGNGAMAFDVEYARWLEEQNRHINELRSAVNSHVGDTELRIIVDNVTTHYDDIYRLKDTAAKADVFHILSGMWKTPAERCFMWIGGFRSSELLKLLLNQLEPLTDQQLMGLYNLQHTSQQAEDALSQGMEALQQSLAETLANSPPGSTESSGNVANYMGQMAMAMGKLGTLEGFLRQADNLRQQTLIQMHRILTTRQSARALLAIHDYFSRLRALSSLWLARPRE
ncbi:transcription factor TGA2.3-like isoform X3 [Syzygium oleosum]|uniref:transcription factor TGA2.3-like isoform X3 n=1 Tax=Syzygium oleosum TaxID=219896 RepID=UPI0011D1C060|nr:transcription factor TGA2.3-like isoform X3 [Syzygium oleosum]